MPTPAPLPPDLATAPWLTAPATQAVLRAIGDGGFEARVVGGAVRNALLGLPVTDIDIATAATPQDVMRLAAAAGHATVPTGLAHGTVTVIADDHPFEVTTLRTDVESHGRHATVAFTSDWAADASRRDFTINALYCGADGLVHDPLGGYGDLVARRVRFIGDAATRIREDYLRILRFFRFTAQYSELAPEPQGLAACVRERAGLARLSGERVRQEMLELLVAARAMAAIEAMREHGILAEVLPMAPRPALLRRLIEIETRQALDPDAALRLAALAAETAEDVARLSARLRLSTSERDRLALGPRAAARVMSLPGLREQRALLYHAGPKTYRGLVALGWARALPVSTTDPAWTLALTLPARWMPSAFPVRGADIIARGVAAGPAVGAALRALEAWWIGQDFAPGRDAVLARFDQGATRAGASCE